MNTNTQLDNAYLHVTRMAMGLNPTSDESIAAESALNNPEVIRTMFFVKDILEKVAKYGIPCAKKTSRPNQKVAFPEDIKKKYVPQGKTSIVRFLKAMYEMTEEGDIKPVSPKAIQGWLLLGGYIEEAHDEEINKDYKKVTEKGLSIGLSNEKVINGFQGRSYVSLIYDKNAQQFVIDNMEKIINGEV